MPDKVLEFLQESNAIEGVYDTQSLDDAVEAWKYLMCLNVLTLKGIKRTHEILMRRQKLRFSEMGEFRRVPVWIGTEKMPHPLEIQPRLLMEFCLPTMRVSPKPDWKALHVVYEKIHPFVDGNGRTGRMFMNWTRMRRCGLPVLVIKESERFAYYDWFKE